jgi:hypothetical protein
MPSLLQVAKKYGAQVVTPNAALPRLAIEAAHAVASGRAWPASNPIHQNHHQTTTLHHHLAFGAESVFMV